MTHVPAEWQLDPENKESKKLNEIISSYVRRLQKNVLAAGKPEEKYAAVFAFYRKYYTLTLNKTSIAAGVNRSPSRDIILDYPWKELNLNRFFCLKIWEKINH
ncbi:MAG TPA: hypothetical protein VNJ01_05135 [Bacteriovoracaceae bacterium]|nr:hypothetical protein [Bacteriovoracaceae bacterium]